MNYVDYMERVIDRQMQSDQHQWIYSQIEEIKKPKKPHRKPPRKDAKHYENIIRNSFKLLTGPDFIRPVKRYRNRFRERILLKEFK